MANILLGVTGSVAAIRTPLLFEALRGAGHEVKVVATEPSLYFFDPAALPDGVLLRDADEWPRRNAGDRWQRDDPVVHIELRKWANLLVIAPLDANTLAKLASGLCDNCLTCVYRAWDPTRPILLAPAMNTFMWLHPVTQRQLRQLCVDYGGACPEAGANLEQIIARINEHCPRLRVLAPISKLLACGDQGVGAMAEVADIVEGAMTLV